MPAQYTSKDFGIVSNIAWRLNEPIANPYYTNSAKTLQVPQSATSSNPMQFWLMWYSKHKQFQVQWRIRKRKNALLESAISGTGEQIWTDWSTWYGNQVDTDSSDGLVSSELAISDNYVTMLSPFSVVYDLSEYDLHEYEVRVRVWDSVPNPKACGSWTTTRLKVGFIPACSLYAYFNSDGTATLDVLTNWARADYTGSIFWVGANEKLTPTIDINSDYSGSTFKIIAPIEAIKNDTVEFSNWSMTTEDGIRFTPAKTIDIEPHAPQIEVPEPLIVTNFTPTKLEGALVSTTGEEYESAEAWISWTDTEGENYVALAEVIKEDTGYSFSVQAPPYETEITINAIVSYEGEYEGRLFVEWDSFTTIATGDARGRFSWVYGDSFVELSLNPSISFNRSFETETIKTAGRTLPISRYGCGQELTIDLSASVAKSEIDREFNSLILQDSHDWIFRTPNGGRYKVNVSSVNFSQEIDGIYNVDISMAVVS